MPFFPWEMHSVQSVPVRPLSSLDAHPLPRPQPSGTVRESAACVSRAQVGPTPQPWGNATVAGRKGGGGEAGGLIGAAGNGGLSEQLRRSPLGHQLFQVRRG